MTVFNQIEGAVIHRRDGWHIVLTFSHTGSGEKRIEESTRAWQDEGQARIYVDRLVKQLADEVRT